MSVDLSTCSYSYLDEFSAAFRYPLFKLTANTTMSTLDTAMHFYMQQLDLKKMGLSEKVWRVAKTAFHWIALITLIVPTGALWIIGRTLIYFARVRVNLDKIHVGPPSLTFTDISRDYAIDLMWASQRFANLFPLDIDRQEDFKKMCQNTVNEKPFSSLSQGEVEAFYAEFSIVLQEIIRDLKSGGVSIDDEKRILSALADAANVCEPTWLEVALKILRDLRAGDGETRLANRVQDYKEAVILEFTDKETKGDWHILNIVRESIGDEIGIQARGNSKDPYSGKITSWFGRKVLKWMVLERYLHANKFLAGVQEQIRVNKEDHHYSDLLAKVPARNKRITNPYDYVQEKWYTDELDTKLKSSGLAVGLREIGVFV